jgi:hypothetical protein
MAPLVLDRGCAEAREAPPLAHGREHRGPRPVVTGSQG